MPTPSLRDVLGVVMERKVLRVSRLVIKDGLEFHVTLAATTEARIVDLKRKREALDTEIASLEGSLAARPQ